MQIDVAILNESVRFQRGRTLPPAQDLIDLLNNLGQAQDAGDKNGAWRLEQKIRSMVTPGVYEGYLKDDLTTYTVRVDRIERKGEGANTQTFHVVLEVLDGTSVLGTRWMELVEFLGSVNRERSYGGQHKGPRFWAL